MKLKLELKQFKNGNYYLECYDLDESESALVICDIDTFARMSIKDVKETNEKFRKNNKHKTK